MYRVEDSSLPIIRMRDNRSPEQLGIKNLSSPRLRLVVNGATYDQLYIVLDFLRKI